MANAYLKGSDGTMFPLRDVTTVGRGNCDFVIKLPCVDYEHCKIEYSEHDGCFVLQDLNTLQGTYVNEVRVQNAAVRLAPGDHIRFGFSGHSFELVLQNETQVSIPPVCQKPPVWSQPPIILTNTDVYNTYTGGGVHVLPHISSVSSLSQTSPTWSHLTTCQPPPVPRPPLRSRPLSAGAAARRNAQNIAAGPTNTVVGAWMKPAEQTLTRTSSIPDLQDKDLKISQLNQEVTTLRNIELESMRKDTVIQQLQEEIDELRVKIHQEPSYILGCDRDMSSKLLHLEAEVGIKKEEIAALKKQLDKWQDDKENSPVLLRQELGERIKEISLLRVELERVKREKSITSGLVTQMQQDMSNKDSTISRLAREIEVLKKDVREKEVHLTSVKNFKEVIRSTEDLSAKEKELINLRQKFKTAENKLQEQLDIITGLRDELNKAQSQVLFERESHRKMQNDLDSLRAQLQDVQRSERVVRVDLEQLQKKSERLRSSVIQLCFSKPAVQAPVKEISDDELNEGLQKMADERAKLLSKIKDLESNVTTAKAGKEELLEEAQKLRQVLQACVNRLKENGRVSGVLKDETLCTQSLSVDDNLVWVRDLFVEVLQAELDWASLIEQSLEKCGVNVKISNDNPSKHIEFLFSKWELSQTEIKSLHSQIRLLKEEHKTDLESKLNILRTEMEDKMQDALEKAQLKGQQDLNAAVDEVRALEIEKRENCLEAEKRKIEELASLLAQMKKTLDEQQQESRSKSEEATNAIQKLETLKVAEKYLKEQLGKLEQQLVDRTVEFSTEKEELVKKFKSEQTAFEEQIKQHSVTICSMEEKLDKLAKEKKSAQDQLSKMKSKPAIPPKVIVQRPREEILALEHVINALRQENAVLKKEIMDSQGIIMGLRRDLAVAAARLTDVSGEMSETQKQEMERNKEMLSQKAGELTDLRQQMAKLSKIIDSQKEDIRKLEVELSKEKHISSKYKCRLEENSGLAEKLEEELQREKEEQKKQLELLENEGHITSELTSLGAQCRGERHEQVIARQREAMAELRTKVKALEQSRPPLSTEDQAIQKIMHLQRELAELRKNQALSENAYIQERSALDTEIRRGRALPALTSAEVEMERSAHRETLDALECSEASYLSLCRCLADILNIEDIGSLASVAHIPRDERERVMELRKSACQILAGHIEALKERLSGKDELLEDYESQLAQFKASLVLEERKAQEVDNLRSNMRTRAEESEYLKQSLHQTQDKLNQEKKLNSLIKDRKLHYSANRHQQCKVEDPQSGVRKKQQMELLKRKNYEIKKLRKVLSDAERELHESQRALTIETGYVGTSYMAHARCGTGCNGCPACRDLGAVTA